jgi:hypothetical protein
LDEKRNTLIITQIALNGKIVKKEEKYEEMGNFLVVKET